MKPSAFFGIRFFLVVMAALALSSCNKDLIDDSATDNGSLKQLSADEINVENASDDAFKDAETVLSLGSGSQKSATMLPCNATIDSSGIVADSISLFITYNGLNCNGTRLREGQVIIRRPVGTNWAQQGAKVRVILNNLSITRVLTNQTLILNGSKTYENLSGGHIWQLATNMSSIVHRISGQLSATFEDSTTRVWKIAKQITYTGTPGQLIRTKEGFGSSGSYNNLVIWGINRQGEDFYSQISQAIQYSENCGWDPIAGIKVHQIPGLNKSATITFGFGSNGQPVTNNDCPSHYRLDWQKNNNSGTLFVAL